MEVMFIVLNHEEHLKDILKTLLDLGVSGATIVESCGMGRLLNSDVPIFAGLSRILEGRDHAGPRTYNKTIFTVIRDPQVADIAAQRIRSILGSFETPDTGILFSVPVTRFFGNRWSKEDATDRGDAR